MVGRFLLAPGGERFRILPMATRGRLVLAPTRLGLFVGWFAFGWVTVGLLATLGMSIEARRLVAYALGLGCSAIALETVWRRPRAGGRSAAGNARRRAGDLAALGLFRGCCGCCWVASAMPGFWLLLVVVGLPLRDAR